MAHIVHDQSSIVPYPDAVATRVREAAGPLAPTAEQVAFWRDRMDDDAANTLAAAVETTLPYLLRALAHTATGRVADELGTLTAALVAFEEASR